MKHDLPLSRALLAASAMALYGATALASGAAPALVVRYDVRDGADIERFELLRTEKRIEHRYLDRGVFELWQRDGRGDLERWTFFVRESKAVHYSAGDLRTIHTWPAWQKLGSLVTPQELAHLAALPRKREVGGEVATTLRGRAHGQIERMVWLDALEVPAEVWFGEAVGPARFHLRSLVRCGDACPFTSLRDVEEVEFADVGDREQDPFVQTFLAYTGRAHSH